MTEPKSDGMLFQITCKVTETRLGVTRVIEDIVKEKLVPYDENYSPARMRQAMNEIGMIGSVTLQSKEVSEAIDLLWGLYSMLASTWDSASEDEPEDLTRIKRVLAALGFNTEIL